MKLIRDKTPDLERGSTRFVHDNVELEVFLRMKLMEEAAEVSAATSIEEFVEEMGDLFEVATKLLTLKKVSFRDILTAADSKKLRKGGFDSGTILMHDPLSNKTIDPQLVKK